MFISAVLYAVAETHVVMLQCARLSVLKLPGINLHSKFDYTLVKGSIFIFICLYTLWAAAVDYKSSRKPATHGSVIFPVTVFSK